MDAHADGDFVFEDDAHAHAPPAPSLEKGSRDGDSDSAGYDPESGGWYGEPWEQQPGEPDRWYQAFQTYLMLGATRSIQRAYRVFHQKRKGEVVASGYWAEKAFLWGWEIRARYWDHHKNEQEREAYTNEKLNTRLFRRQIIEDIGHKFYENIDQLDDRELSWRSATDMFKAVTEAMRTEYDDVPAAKTEVTIRVELALELGDQIAEIFARVNGLPSPQERQEAFLDGIAQLQERNP